MPNALVVFLPPSEAKVPGGDAVRADGRFDAALRRSRREVALALYDFVRSAPPERLATTLNARGPLLKRAVSAAKQIATHRAPLLPAWQRYSGVVWTHLDPSTLSEEQRSRLLVPSGLYGLTSSDDLIADYRLRMNVGLPGLGNVGTFWRTRLVAALSSCPPSTTFVNLLPKEHESALDLELLGNTSDVVNVMFSQRGGAAAGHDAKAVKGVLARRLLQDGIGVLESFDWHEWRVSHEDGAVTIVGPQVARAGVRATRHDD